METNYVVHVGVMLKDNLEAIGLSQKELSEKTGISTTIINEIIKGKRKINTKVAQRLEEIFGLPAKYWLDIQIDCDLAKEKNASIIEITDDNLFNANYSANQIADRFICYEDQACEVDEFYEKSLTPLKLQKLLYFAQKEFIKSGTILFTDPIKHWDYGPVVLSVYERFRSSREVIDADIISNPLPDDIEKVLKSVYNKYKKYTASYLVELSHKELPWLNTNRDEIITPELIKSYM